MINKGKARAYTNIALIKYWGKRDEEYNLPMNSSLSLTLDALYTETEVSFDPSLEEDVFYLNGQIQGREERDKVTKFLDLFRMEVKIETKARIVSLNRVPTAAGLASSASGFAALALAANEATGLKLGPRELSSYARQGSGSASRSLYGGFVEWQKGESKDDSYAVKVDEADWDIGMIIVLVNSGRKKISSRKAMKLTVETSPFYEAWTRQAEEDIKEAKEAIKAKDFERLGLVSERNALMMHATMLGARPPISYWEGASLEVMDLVRDLRSQGIQCYFTMDAGPNVKILARLSEAEKIKEKLREVFEEDRIIISGPGPEPLIL